jgi:hypothetical protein
VSRGHGSRQPAIIDTLTVHAAQHPPMDDFDADGQLKRGDIGQMLDVPPSFLTARDLAADTTNAALESTKRALRKLKAEAVIELCHGLNHVLGARIAPPDEVQGKWRVALDDHLYVQDSINFYERRLWIERDALRGKLKELELWAFDGCDQTQDRKDAAWSVEHYEEKVRVTYAQVKQDCREWLPSVQAQRQPPTEEQLRKNGELIAAASAAFKEATT